ncbi:hypothetical protein [Bradyrhizobium guangdongense]|nr:hypothetical protein [Bradyrhizobium guangdongense]
MLGYDIETLGQAQPVRLDRALALRIEIDRLQVGNSRCAGNRAIGGGAIGVPAGSLISEHGQQNPA